MKYHTLFISIIIISLLTSLMSCNDDAFVKELDISTTELQMDGEGDSSVVTFNKSPEWGVLSVDQSNNSSINEFYGKVYDENGTILYNYVTFYQNPLKQKGKLVYQSSLNGFTVKRSDDKKIEISVDENLSDQDFRFTVWIGDYDKNIPIHITQVPSAGYDFDHINYSLTPMSYYQNWEESNTNLVIYNHSDNPMTVGVSIFSDERQSFTFSSQNPKAFAFLKPDVQVAIPDSVINDEIKISSKKTYYKDSEQKTPPPFEDVKKTITFEKGKTKITKILEYSYFNADYTLYIRNRKTGKVKSVTGTLHCKMLTGKYMVALKKLS